ncbi:hypothetical protein [Pyrococcus horikoshii]|uniref:Uncharacterized protein n=1 Tax=Pyrococcus horikoshii TaxID=53953 RepID=A0A832SM64_PYRHR|nr:hypothetical protein [Pyrococcus horikoshii]HII60777.1 hypothetical protein [Pyrococcus horikoshii]
MNVSLSTLKALWRNFNYPDTKSSGDFLRNGNFLFKHSGLNFGKLMHIAKLNPFSNWEIKNGQGK